MASASEMIDSYLAGVETLRKSVAGMSREQMQARPIPGKWSSQEVVCHLADFEPIMADRMKRIVAEDRPTLLGADENRFAEALAYAQRDVTEELAIVAQTRSQMARILRTLAPEAWSRVGVHNERGPRTLEQLLTGAIGHIVHHVKFIDEKRRALGLSP
jgi:uncharacterized damage-inducible protein DinB